MDRGRGRDVAEAIDLHVVAPSGMDLGMVGHLDSASRGRLVLLLLAIGQGDTGLVVEVLDQMTRLAVKHRVPLPTELVMVGKAIGQVQNSVAQLAPDLDPMQEATRYLGRSLIGRLTRQLNPEQLIFELERARYRLGQIGDALVGAAGSASGGKLELRPLAPSSAGAESTQPSVGHGCVAVGPAGSEQPSSSISGGSADSGTRKIRGRPSASNSANSAGSRSSLTSHTSETQIAPS